MNPPVLIFVQSMERAKELYRELAFSDIKVDVIHSDLQEAQVMSILCPVSCFFIRYPVYDEYSVMHMIYGLLPSALSSIRATKHVFGIWIMYVKLLL